MLGLSRLQHRRLRRDREPASKMYGRTSTTACAGKYDQLPSFKDAETCFESEEAKVDVLALMLNILGEWEGSWMLSGKKFAWIYYMRLVPFRTIGMNGVLSWDFCNNMCGRIRLMRLLYDTCTWHVWVSPCKLDVHYVAYSGIGQLQSQAFMNKMF